MSPVALPAELQGLQIEDASRGFASKKLKTLQAITPLMRVLAITCHNFYVTQPPQKVNGDHMPSLCGSDGRIATTMGWLGRLNRNSYRTTTAPHIT